MDGKSEMVWRRFNRSAVAGDYDAHAHVQRLMAAALMELVAGHSVEKSRGDAAILEIGCGTGTLTGMLQHAWPHSEITALDVAPAMLEEAQRRLQAPIPQALTRQAQFARPPWQAGVRFLHADVEDWAPATPSGSYDLIMSSACFQWLVRPQQTLRELLRLLRPGGMLAFTTFGAQTFQELHAAFELAYRAQGLSPQRHGLRLRTAEEWDALLTGAGFLHLQHRQRVHIERHPTVRHFLQTVKAVGASASEASSANRAGLQMRRLFHDMFDHYELRYGSPDDVRVTYELLLWHGVAPE